MLVDGSYDLKQDRQSTTHQLYFLENPKTEEDHADRSDDCSVAYENQTVQSSIIFLVKECQEVESSILRNPSSCDQFDDVPAASATAASSKVQKMKSCLGEGGEESKDGFQTPTKFLVSSSGLKCPPAPRKPKAEPLGKRRRVCRRSLQSEFVSDVELELLRLVSSGDPKLKKKACTLEAGEANNASGLGA